ncbi:hypothetical protein JTE90_020136 [Oedothorax gibbosus]|uniref:Uncharacterized protein n=1 Tax=Oedothorax gibbosus TaxID=931172 RepID=A0AAV6UA86_9ARAC|nr:hypothetical protein JTE90_020136 [Oedothorax gibbosus]
MHSFTPLGTIEVMWNAPKTITAEVHFQVGLNLQTVKSVTANAVSGSECVYVIENIYYPGLERDRSLSLHIATAGE